MEAIGILMTAITLFGMLVLTVAHVNLGSGSQTFGTKQKKSRSVELKQAA